MPTYERCPLEINQRASDVLCRHDTYKPVVEAKIKIDFIFASGDRDETGELANDAITKNGVRCFGLCKIVGPKDRAMGRGDVEILIDRDWWGDASEERQDALLDHELHHIVPREKNGTFVVDDQGRPKIKMRAHDYEFGWFTIVAKRNVVSTETDQARQIYEIDGQTYWPFLKGTEETTRFGRVAEEAGHSEATVSIHSGGKEIAAPMPLKKFTELAKKRSNK